MNTMGEIEGYFDQYGPIALEVVSGEDANIHLGLPQSNTQVCWQICQTMRWPEFNLFENHDFQAVEALGTRDMCLAYGLIAFLRWQVFTLASDRGVGLPHFNMEAVRLSEDWYVRLMQRCSHLQLNPHLDQRPARLN
jgi:hypothetical protein